MRKRVWILSILGFALCVAAAAYLLGGLAHVVIAATGSRVPTQMISLRSRASGGILTVVRLQGRNAESISIETRPGEPAGSVSKRLALALSEAYGKEWFSEGPRAKLSRDEWLEKAESGVLDFPLIGGYVLAGTETGLEIPKPSLSLSASYDPKGSEVILKWVNPPERYENIAFLYGKGEVFGAIPPRRVFVGAEKSIPGKLCDIHDGDFRVVCCRGAPSNAAAIHLCYNSQDELFGIPFTGGVAPNWESWLAGGNRKDVECQQGTREELVAKPGVYPHKEIQKPTDKPFYQIVKTKKPEGKAGIWRKFLGLTPGHKYRVTALLNTLDMDKAKGQWSFSFHAARNAPGGKDFTPEQMSGEAALPDGSKGEKAGRIVCYGPGQTTTREWVYSSTDPAQRCPGREIGDITLPEKVDTITVWLRHQAEDSKGVGYLWIKLEDLSMPPLPQNPAK